MAEESPSVVAGEGMLEIRRDCQQFERFIRELFGQKMGETVPELLVRKFPRAALKLPANKFEPVRSVAAEALDG
jgi:hypothetical protein